MPELSEIILVCGIVIVILLLGISLCLLLQNPFRYPYFTWTFDVTGKKNVRVEDYVDRFLSDKNNWEKLQRHEAKIENWKKDCNKRIENSKLRKYRERQYLAILDDKGAYRFKTTRTQTRYKQKNYIREGYKVDVVDRDVSTSWAKLEKRYNTLAAIGFEATMFDYNSKNQRKLMTPSLRKDVMIRDRFTCQMCGKYMPDEVGLQIDHIVPIAKGGKSVASNLQVLCSKCNGKKGKK